ncbi:unnamed protein product [Cuscuta europaea]|uniref:Zinc knuckle CX2CX4HX4C domain-containing protein n=1 Tax=Cuscuta europaea TaxID=41803 RepID=A0A9P1EG29_CUSEU|nr:unnamed protein product [Cuscuta europaea]
MKKETTLKEAGIGHWVDFKYEKLPNFCFICAIIGHTDKFCPLIYEDNLVLEKTYGVNLRAVEGVKTSPTGGNKWLEEGSFSAVLGSSRKEDTKTGGGTGGQGWRESTTGTGDSSTIDGEFGSTEEMSGEQK